MSTYKFSSLFLLLLSFQSIACDSDDNYKKFKLMQLKLEQSKASDDITYHSLKKYRTTLMFIVLLQIMLFMMPEIKCILIYKMEKK